MAAPVIQDQSNDGPSFFDLLKDVKNRAKVISDKATTPWHHRIPGKDDLVEALVAFGKEVPILWDASNESDTELRAIATAQLQERRQALYDQYFRLKTGQEIDPNSQPKEGFFEWIELEWARKEGRLPGNELRKKGRSEEDYVKLVDLLEELRKTDYALRSTERLAANQFTEQMNLVESRQRDLKELAGQKSFSSEESEENRILYQSYQRYAQALRKEQKARARHNNSMADAPFSFDFDGKAEAEREYEENHYIDFLSKIKNILTSPARDEFQFSPEVRRVLSVFQSVWKDPAFLGSDFKQKRLKVLSLGASADPEARAYVRRALFALGILLQCENQPEKVWSEKEIKAEVKVCLALQARLEDQIKHSGISFRNNFWRRFSQGLAILFALGCGVSIFVGWLALAGPDALPLALIGAICTTAFNATLVWAALPGVMNALFGRRGKQTGLFLGLKTYTDANNQTKQLTTKRKALLGFMIVLSFLVGVGFAALAFVSAMHSLGFLGSGGAVAPAALVFSGTLFAMMALMVFSLFKYVKSKSLKLDLKGYLEGLKAKNKTPAQTVLSSLVIVIFLVLGFYALFATNFMNFLSFEEIMGGLGIPDVLGIILSYGLILTGGLIAQAAYQAYISTWLGEKLADAMKKYGLLFKRVDAWVQKGSFSKLGLILLTLFVYPVAAIIDAPLAILHAVGKGFISLFKHKSKVDNVNKPAFLSDGVTTQSTVKTPSVELTVASSLTSPASAELPVLLEVPAVPAWDKHAFLPVEAYDKEMPLESWYLAVPVNALGNGILPYAGLLLLFGGNIPATILGLIGATLNSASAASLAIDFEKKPRLTELVRVWTTAEGKPIVSPKELASAYQIMQEVFSGNTDKLPLPAKIKDIHTRAMDRLREAHPELSQLSGESLKVRQQDYARALREAFEAIRPNYIAEYTDSHEKPIHSQALAHYTRFQWLYFAKELENHAVTPSYSEEEVKAAEKRGLNLPNHWTHLALVSAARAHQPLFNHAQAAQLGLPSLKRAEPPQTLGAAPIPTVGVGGLNGNTGTLGSDSSKQIAQDPTPDASSPDPSPATAGETGIASAAAAFSFSLTEGPISSRKPDEGVPPSRFSSNDGTGEQPPVDHHHPSPLSKAQAEASNQSG